MFQYLYYFLISITIGLFLLWLILKVMYSRYCKSKVCLIGKTAIITGGNKGIGYEISLGLAARGCKIIIACRSNCDRLRELMIKQTHNPNICVKYLDLSSIDSVRNFARDISNTEKSIDILINNGGISRSKMIQTPDGLNPVMQTNYFGHFLLTHLLIDLLKKSADARVIFLTSFLAFQNNLTLKNLKIINRKLTSWDDFYLYANSKACQIIAAVLFSEKLKPYGIAVNAVHPGLVQTNIFQEVQSVQVNKMYLFLLYAIGYFYLKCPEEGAQPILKTAISNIYRKYHGRLIWDLNWFPLPKCARNKEFIRQVWEASEECVGLTLNEKI